MAATDSIVKVSALRKRFGTNEVLKGIDLDVKRGEVIAIIGKSGSGKSTLLRCINGLEVFQDGALDVDGQPLRHGDAKAMRALRQHVGMIFQNFNLIPSMTAIDNVALALAFGGVRGGERRRRAHELLSRVGLKERVDHRPAELSGGEQQRVAIARALANRPRLLLDDEPSGNLDSTRAEDILSLLRDMVEQDGLTVLMVTHDRELGARFATRNISMKDGRIDHESTRHLLARSA